MIFLYENINIFDKFELDYLENNCNNFNPHNIPTKSGEISAEYRNYYNRFLIMDSPYIDIISKKITNFLNKKIEENKINIKKFTKPKQGVWINKIDSDSNKDDDYHRDESDITVIIYLNDLFEGGEFEYIDKNNKPIKIKPKKNSIIISNKELLHRVLPVSSGVRYSLVSFFQFDRKTNKTII